RQLGVLHHPALVEDDMLLGVDAGCQKSSGNRARLRRQIRLDELRGNRMHVDDAIDAIVMVLQRDEIADRAEIIAEMQISGGLDTRENERLETVHVTGPGLVEGLVSRRGQCVGAYDGWRGADQVAALLLHIKIGRASCRERE